MGKALSTEYDVAPVEAKFQFDARPTFLAWFLYDESGEELGWTHNKTTKLPVAVSQFFNRSNWRWIARLDNGEFLDVKSNMEKFAFIPEE